MLKGQNILFIVKTMGIGGTENVVLQLCEILKQHVNKIVVCSLGGRNEKQLQLMGIKHYKIMDISSKNPIVMLKNYNSIQDIVIKEEITIIHSHHRMAAFFAELVAPYNVKKVANAHNTFENRRRLTRFAYRNTRLIAVGEMVCKNLTEYFKIPKEKVCVIHNAVKPFEQKVEPIEELKEICSMQRVLIGNIGRLSKQKGMKYFIQAAEIVEKKHPEACFIIVGDGEEKEMLRDLVRVKKLQNTVLFLGYREDIQNVISQMDFIVLSSLWEGLPLTPIEAFSVGKAVIGTAVDGTIEIIQDKINGCLVRPRDVKQLAEKIIYLIENTKVRLEMGKMAKEYYEKEFSYKKLEQEYIMFYSNL